MILGSPLSTAVLRRPAAVAAAPFDPTDFGASLFAYYNAENAASVPQSAGAVTTWTDTVTGYAPTQGTGANRPVWAATSFNSRPGITFDGTNDQLNGPSTHPYPTGTGSYEIWSLVDQQTAFGTSAFGETIITSWGSVTSGTIAHGHIDFAATVVGVTQWAATQAKSNTIVFSGKHVLRTIVTATTIQTDIDGTAGVPVAAVAAPDNAGFFIGAHRVASLNFKGVMNKLLITASLNAGQATQMYAFLKPIGGVA